MIGTVVVAALLVLPGCSAVPEGDYPTRPSATPSAAANGTTLVSLGLSHAPATITLPPGVGITRQVNQPNVVTVLIRANDGAAVLAHLEQNLAAEGFTISSRSADSLIFASPAWEGAYTMNDQVAGLTLRKLS